MSGLAVILATGDLVYLRRQRLLRSVWAATLAAPAFVAIAIAFLLPVTGTGEVAKLRAAIAEHVPAIIERLTEAARSGDVAAARLLLERVIAPLKSHEAPVSISLPDGTLAEQGRAIVASVATGGHPESPTAGAILRAVFWHSLALALLVGVLVMMQARLFPSIIPAP